VRGVAVPFGVATPPDPDTVGVTWLGHDTVHVEHRGCSVLTDPALLPRLAHLRRRTPVPAPPRADVVLVTHLHMDHLHRPSLRLVAPGATLVVPAGGGTLVRGLGAREVVEVRVGDVVPVSSTTGGSDGSMAVRVVPANHLRGRGPHSRASADPVGYVVETGGRRIYIAGDTDLFEDMRTLGPLDVAMIPIWGWGPTLGERHLDPVTAATATEWLDPATVVPVHWGTYSPVRPRRGSPPWLDRPIAAFRESLQTHGLEDRLLAVSPSGSFGVPRAD
jgi:L-ascorbate metabolism protein UlaG (beta-lactamase superfamily)